MTGRPVQTLYTTDEFEFVDGSARVRFHLVGFVISNVASMRELVRSLRILECPRKSGRPY